MADNFDDQLVMYLNHIRAEYISWQNEITVSTGGASFIRNMVRQEMIDRFVNSVRVECGSRYIKIVADNSAHSFVVLVDTPKFPRGTILKAASWRAPATNFGRGNILTGDWTRATWTGVI